MQDARQAEEILAAEAGIAVLGKVALANPIFPNRVRATQETDAFTPAILGSIATIKPSEPAARAMRPVDVTLSENTLRRPRRMWSMDHDR